MRTENPRGRRRPRLPVVAVVAVAVAVAGTATAQGLIDGRDLINGSVTRAKLQINAIGNAQIASGAVTGNEIRNRSVRAANLANGSVGTVALANGAVTNPRIANGAVTGAKVRDGSIQAVDLAPGASLPSVTTRAVEVTIQPGPAQAAEAVCLSGEVALGGGYASIPPENANVLNNRPVPAANATRPTGWAVLVRNGTGAATQIVVYAICARQ